MTDIRTYDPASIRVTFANSDARARGWPEQPVCRDDLFDGRGLRPIALVDREAIEWPDVDQDGVAHYFMARLAQICPFHFIQEPGCVNPATGQDIGAQWPAHVLVERTLGRDYISNNPILNGSFVAAQDERRARGINTWREWGPSPLIGIRSRVSELDLAIMLHDEAIYGPPLRHRLPSGSTVRLRARGVGGPTSAALWALCR